MVDIDKLRGKIVEKRMSVSDVARKMGVDKATLYRRFSDAQSLTIGEATKIAEILCLTNAEAVSIFFSDYVA